MIARTALVLICMAVAAGAEATADMFGPQQVITTDVSHARSVFAADLDGDGDMDVLSASSDDNKIAWYENTDGEGSFGPQQIISTAADLARSVYAADLDKDGDLDVISGAASDLADNVVWYENTNGAGSFGAGQVISTGVEAVYSVFAADIDGDGDADVVSGSAISLDPNHDRTVWYENMDGAGTFGPRQIIYMGRAVSVFVEDVDGDSDLDVIAATLTAEAVVWYENTDGAGTFGTPQFVVSGQPAPFFPASVFAADIDGDKDTDVVTASFPFAPTPFDKVIWSENTDGAGTFGTNHVITGYWGGASAVFAADLDRDADMDVLSASGWGDKIFWHENKDGAGTFGTEQLIYVINGPMAVFAADLDGDWDPDVLSANNASPTTISWSENLRPDVIPALTGWVVILLAGLLLAIAIWLVRRRSGVG